MSTVALRYDGWVREPIMLKWQITSQESGETRVRLKGDITERVSFDDLDLEGDHIVLVPDGIRYINSTGVKRLLKFMEVCCDTAKVTLERCSPAIVAQLNLVPRLADCVSVRSVIAPLECVECVAVNDVLVELGDAVEPPELPARECAVCGAKMQLAELEERYFSFMSSKE
jgi:hypothetical protein